MIFVILFVIIDNVDTTPVNVEESLDSENKENNKQKTICENAAIVPMEVNSVVIIILSS